MIDAKALSEFLAALYNEAASKSVSPTEADGRRSEMIGRTLTRRLKQLEHLEQVRRTQIAAESTGARERIMADLNRIAERMKAGGNWPPEPQPTAEEVERRILAIFAGREKRP